MYEVNRSVAIIRPQAPFLEWLKGLSHDIDPSLSLASLGWDCNAILIPAADDLASMQHFVLEHYRVLFEAELADWCDDDRFWPEALTPELFAAWFDIQIHSVLTDLVEEPLQRAAFVPLDLDLE
jgi:hypothetical protein